MTKPSTATATHSPKIINEKPRTEAMSLTEYQDANPLPSRVGHNWLIYQDLIVAASDPKMTFVEATPRGCLVGFRNRNLANKAIRIIAGYAAEDGLELYVLPPSMNKADAGRFLYLMPAQTSSEDASQP